jgi:transcriptional regulator with XRE-family HTH domain
MGKNDIESLLDTGQIIRDARRAKGLTQEQLAHSLGVSSTTVSRWERNLQRPSVLDCERLAKRLSSRGRPFLSGDFAA